jgi:hypothetical protein
LYYLSAIFCIVYLSTLYGNNIRIRYFIPVLPILVILNIEAIRNLINTKKLTYLAHIAAVLFLLINFNYAMVIFKELNLSSLNPLSPGSKEKYLKDNLLNYDIFEYINKNTPENSVIYEAFTGGRSYYINRTFYCDTTSLDRYLFDLAMKGATAEEYAQHFGNLPNSELSATHLLIRADSFISTFINMNANEQDPENSESISKLQGYIKFLQSLELLYDKEGTNLFKILPLVN